MNWLEQITITKFSVADDLRPPYTGSMWTCPNCSSYNSTGQVLPQCPGCNRDTTGLQSYLCPDCKTRISTGKKGDCDKCGFDWTPQPITLEDPISSLGSGVKHGHLPQLAYDVGAKTINDVIRIDYEAIKANLFEWWQRGQSGFGANRWEGKTEEEIAEIRHTQVMGRLHNLIFEIFNYTKYPYAQLPPEYISWATYLNDSFEKDSQVIEHKDNQNRKIEEYENKRRLEEEAKEQKARVLADELYRRKGDIWSDMDEDTTPEDALEIARDFINASPHQRGQWRGPIRDIARELFSREFPEKQYFMEPEEAHKFVKETQKKLEWYANKWELVKDDELLDIISKAVGITNSKSPQDLDWDTEGVHPGYTATYVLAPAANMRYYGMQELARRLKEKKDDRAYINQMYSNIDEDIRSLFFRSKLAFSPNWLRKVVASDIMAEYDNLKRLNEHIRSNPPLAEQIDNDPYVANFVTTYQILGLNSAYDPSGFGDTMEWIKQNSPQKYRSSSRSRKKERMNNWRRASGQDNWFQKTAQRTYYHCGDEFIEQFNLSQASDRNDQLGVFGSIRPNWGYGDYCTAFTVHGNILGINHPQRIEIARQILMPDIDAELYPDENAMLKSTQTLIAWEFPEVLSKLKEMGFDGVEGSMQEILVFNVDKIDITDWISISDKQ